MVVIGESQGHETFAIRPPGTDLDRESPSGPPGITVQWTATYTSPAPDDESIASLRFPRVQGGNGETYTRTVWDQQLVAAFPWREGTLLITGTGGWDLTIDVFEHLIHSLRLGP